MKQLIQSYRSGTIGLFDVPAPRCDDHGILMANRASLVSAGTEKMLLDLARKSLVGKAVARPDLVRQVFDKMKKEGLMVTLNKVFTKLETPIPLGYSAAGEVIDAGKEVKGVSIGDRVACGGARYANHAEINYIPKNLFVKIPEKIEDSEACFVAVGAIALQGVRQACVGLGETVAVLGLGLIGQLTVQLLKANGCHVLASDIDDERVALARQLGADHGCQADELISAASTFANGHGVDAVMVTASTSSSQPLVDAGEICRAKGRVIVVGMVRMHIPRNLYYKKEIDIRLSMAYGPGRYDPAYEEKGIDYPYHYVRWTAQRNFSAFLNLISEGKVTPKALITHQFNFTDALKAYDLLEGKTKERYMGLVLNYGSGDQRPSKRIVLDETKPAIDMISVGMIGAGNFTKSTLLPVLKRKDGVDLVGLCTATGISAHSTGTKNGFKFISTDASEILNHSEINTVIITTHHDTHAPYTIKALKKGKDVFVEKPLCLNEEQLDEIRKTVIGKDTASPQKGEKDQSQSNEIKSSLSNHLMVGFNRRFSPMILEMKKYVGDRPMSIHYRINAGVIPMDSWIQDPYVGGGRIVGEICHFIDTCSFLTGSLPVEVFASCVRKADQSVPDEDNLTVLLKFDNGSSSTIQYAAYGDRRLSKEYIEVFAPAIAIQMNDFRWMILYKNGKRKKMKRSKQDKGFSAEIDAFLSGIRRGVPPIPFESIHRVTLATFKIQESLRTGLPVSLV